MPKDVRLRLALYYMLVLSQLVLRPTAHLLLDGGSFRDHETLKTIAGFIMEKMSLKTDSWSVPSS